MAPNLPKFWGTAGADQKMGHSNGNVTGQQPDYLPNLPPISFGPLSDWEKVFKILYQQISQILQI
ncbi:MAG: hypothetical protein WAS33_06795 [Candidatus Promineifilaceae bacterium]